MELASLYTVPLSAVNGLSCLTKLTRSKAAGTADSILKISNRPITLESNRIGQPIRIRIESRSFAGPYPKVLSITQIVIRPRMDICTSYLCQDYWDTSFVVSFVHWCALCVHYSDHGSSEKVGWWHQPRGQVCGSWVHGYYPQEIFENVGANLCNLVHFGDIRSSKVGRKMDGKQTIFHPTFKRVHCPCSIGSAAPGSLTCFGVEYLENG